MASKIVSGRSKWRRTMSAVEIAKMRLCAIHRMMKTLKKRRYASFGLVLSHRLIFAQHCELIPRASDGLDSRIVHAVAA